MKVSKNTQQLQKTKYLGSSVENKVELEGKQRVHREFSVTPKGRTNEFEYGSLERILSRENLNFAIQRAKTYIDDGYRWVVDIDLEKFFDKVNHDILMYKLSKSIKDKRVLKLIRKYLQSGILINGVVTKNEDGTPQGGPLSPLLSNIMLDELDKELEKRGHKFCRYADDCNIYVKSERAGKRVMNSITTFIEDKLKLKVNIDKSAVARPWRRKYLGFSLFMYLALNCSLVAFIV